MARIRKVYPAEMVAHLWANQSQSEARTAKGNCSFDGNVIYSYRLAIGAIVNTVEGEKVALLYSPGNSVTTERHKRNVRSALRSEMKRFYVADVPDRSDGTFFRSYASHESNVKHKVAELHASFETGCNSVRRSHHYRYAASHIAQLEHGWNDIWDYCQAFGLRMPFIDLRGMNAELNLLERERAERESDPKRNERNAKASARKAELTAKRIAIAEAWLLDQTKEAPNLEWFSDRYRSPTRHIRRAIEAIRMSNHYENKFLDFMTGKTSECPSSHYFTGGTPIYDYVKDLNDYQYKLHLTERYEANMSRFATYMCDTQNHTPMPYLGDFPSTSDEHATLLAIKAYQRDNEARLRAERMTAQRLEWIEGIGRNDYQLTCTKGGALLRVRGETLQTSQGAEIPLAHAVRAFRWIASIVAHKSTWQRNGAGARVGAFTIDSVAVTSDGDAKIRAGCHTLYFSEMKRVALDVGVSLDQEVTSEHCDA
jgi:hypothetical protein